MAKRRGDLRGHGDGSACRTPCRNLVLLVDRSDRSRGPDGSVGAGEVAQLGACRRYRGGGFPVGVPPQPYGQEQLTGSSCHLDSR